MDSKDLRDWDTICGLLSVYFLGTSSRKGKKISEEQNYMVKRFMAYNCWYEYVNLEMVTHGRTKKPWEARMGALPFMALGPLSLFLTHVLLVLRLILPCRPRSSYFGYFFFQKHLVWHRVIKVFTRCVYFLDNMWPLYVLSWKRKKTQYMAYCIWYTLTFSALFSCCLKIPPVIHSLKNTRLL